MTTPTTSVESDKVGFNNASYWSLLLPVGAFLYSFFLGDGSLVQAVGAGIETLSYVLLMAAILGETFLAFRLHSRGVILGAAAISWFLGSFVL